MKKTLSSIVFVLLSSLASRACFNVFYAFDKHGHYAVIGDLEDQDRFDKNFDAHLYEIRLTLLQSKLLKQKDYRLLSDYSVYLAKLGKTKEALDLLITLYHYHPDEYQVAANLGTAYELNGEVDSAYKYISRGLELNPQDHEGSEWIHLRILDAKKQLRSDPHYLDTHSVLGLTEKQKNDTIVFRQLHLQLQERFPFTPRPDAIMAGLFNDLGDISANTRSIEYARAYYMIAKDYFGDTSAALSQKIRNSEKLITKYGSRHIKDLQSGDKFGSVEHIGFISYRQLLHSYDSYNVKWDRIDANVPELLKTVGLQPYENKAVATAKDATQQAQTPTTASQETNSKKIFYLCTVIVLLIGLGGFWVWRRK